MSLTSLFNFSYLKENIKKSKAIILLCILLIPVISGIILLMNCSQDYNFMPSMFEISGLVLVGMYVVPVILAITLFNFVYKRGSSDFVLSMPINKKQIFLTNTLGGILIVLVMQVINFIIMLLISLIYSNIIIPYKMLFDIFIIYSISYIFVFVCTNIAISVSANKITSVVVTLLIMFLIPFISTFINTDGFSYDVSGGTKIECVNNECKPKNYSCSDVKCEIDKKNNIYRADMDKVYNATYTMPYHLIYNTIFGYDTKTNINSSIIKMSILSIIYIVVGLILFKNKKFEVVGTSFRNEKIHILVRTLTTIPIVCILYSIVRNFEVSSYDFFAIIFLLVLVFAYLIIYDLITRKKVTNFFKMAICLFVVGILVVGSSIFFDKDNREIKASDIKTISFVSDTDNVIGISKNGEVINYVLSLLLDNNSLDDYYYTYHINTSVKGSTYGFDVYATKDDYNYINNLLNNDKEFIKSLKKYNNANVFGIKYSDGYVSVNTNNNLSDMIINKYKNDNNVFKINNDRYSDLFNITLYSYDNFSVRNIDVNVSDDKNIVLGILRYYNSNTKKFFNNIDDDEDIYSYYVNGNYYDFNGESYGELSKFIINNINDDINVNDKYSYIVINSNSGRYIFTTNKVEELDDIVKKYSSSDIYDDAEDDLVM